MDSLDMLLKTTSAYRSNSHSPLSKFAISILKHKSKNYVVIHNYYTAFLAIKPIIPVCNYEIEVKIIVKILSEFILTYSMKIGAISSNIENRTLGKCLAIFCRQNNILHQQQTKESIIIEKLTKRAILHLFNECKDELSGVQIALNAFSKHGSVDFMENHHQTPPSLHNRTSNYFATVFNNIQLKPATQIFLNQNEQNWKSMSQFTPKKLRPINLTTVFKDSPTAPVIVESAFQKGRNKYMFKNQEMPEIYGEEEKDTDKQSCLNESLLTSNNCCCCCGQMNCKPPKTCPAIAGHYSRLCTNSNRVMQLVKHNY